LAGSAHEGLTGTNRAAINRLSGNRARGTRRHSRPGRSGSGGAWWPA